MSSDTKNIGSFNSIIELLEYFSDEQSCIRYFEALRWKDGIISPYDPKSEVYKYKDGRYRCKNTGKFFNIRTGTFFENTKISLRKWVTAIWLLNAHKKGISSLQLSRDIKVTQKTAWFMLQRIRNCYCFEFQSKLSNKVELDETFVGGKNKNRHWDKKVKYSQGRSFKDKTPVLGMLERGGKLVCRVIKNTTQKEITPHVLEVVSKDAIIYTDEWKGYNTVDKLYTHYSVDHGKGQYVNGDIYTNTLEGAWSILKRSIIGIYHYTSKKHLQKYVDEFVFHYNTRKLSDREKFDLFLGNMERRITYKQLVA